MVDDSIVFKSNDAVSVNGYPENTVGRLDNGIYSVFKNRKKLP
jgi:hypothetical protein